MPWLDGDSKMNFSKREMRMCMNLVSELTPLESRDKLFLNLLDQVVRAKFIKLLSLDPIMLAVWMPTVR